MSSSKVASGRAKVQAVGEALEDGAGHSDHAGPSCDSSCDICGAGTMAFPLPFTHTMRIKPDKVGSECSAEGAHLNLITQGHFPGGIKFIPSVVKFSFLNPRSPKLKVKVFWKSN